MQITVSRRILVAACAALLCLLLPSCGKGVRYVEDPVEYVNTLVGTMSDFSLSAGNTYPAIALPWGMNFWTPQTGKDGDGWQYTYGAHEIRGFKQTHQPSPWINDYASFSIMPVRLQKGASYADMIDQDARKSIFSHLSETARPYYYSVYLADHDVTAEITPTERAAQMRFTYPESAESGLVIDSYGGSIEVIDSCTVVGITVSNHGGVPDNFANFFIIKSDKPFMVAASRGVSDVALAFRTVRGEQVTLKVASSFISAEQAERNLGEADGSFDEVCAAAKARWNEVLGRIKVGGGKEEDYRTFYSCLYRSTLFPRKFWEEGKDGKPRHYSPYDGKVHDGYLYTDNGFWDTFRAQFPLLNLVYPEESARMLAGFANVARENAFLPEWCSPGHRDCMIGNNSASIVADAAVKGLVAPADLKALYDALVYGSEHVHPSVKSSGRLGCDYYNTLGYVPCDVGIRESTARTLEYAYDDWCILQIARILDRPQEELDKWEARSRNWRNVFDAQSRLMRGRKQDGSFAEPFSPYKWGGDFTEGNSWHYTWSVFHDIPGLVEAMGGSDSFEQMLDSVFVVPPIYDDSSYGFRIHEIAEMQVAAMGNYAHGNQPAQHVIYLYDYVGAREKTDKWVNEVRSRLYKATPDGYCGDEDNGQTSAWYVFSSLGFYPVCPGSNEYALCSPLFTEFRINPEGGKAFGMPKAEGNFISYENLTK